MKKIILATLGLGLLVVGVNANAGEGGIAGAVAVHTSAAGVLNWTSSSVAIGKSSAVSGAVSTAGAEGIATSFAVGTGGTVVLDSTTGLVDSVTEDITLGKVQGNSLTTAVIDINATADTTTGVVAPPPPPL